MAGTTFRCEVGRDEKGLPEITLVFEDSEKEFAIRCGVKGALQVAAKIMKAVRQADEMEAN